MKTKMSLNGSLTKLRDKKVEDAVSDFNWQTDEEICRLNAVSKPHVSFYEFFNHYTVSLKISRFIKAEFAVETKDGKHIGNCTYYNIDAVKQEAEVGITIGLREFWSKGYGSDALLTLLDYIFSETQIKRLYLKTLESNLRAQKAFRKCGFTEYGKFSKNGNNFILMQIYKNNWICGNYHQNKQFIPDI